MKGRKRSLSDLSDYLFDELDRLSNDDLTGEDLDAELKRAKGLCAVASGITRSAAVQLNAIKFASDMGITEVKALPDTILSVKEDEGK